LNVIKQFERGTLARDLSYPSYYIFMKYEITPYMIILFVLTILNFFYIKNDMLSLFLLIEILLVLS
jgi:hypothetical protein